MRLKKGGDTGIMRPNDRSNRVLKYRPAVFRVACVICVCALMTMFHVAAANAQTSYQVRVNSMRFYGGGGIGPTSSGAYRSQEYYRAYGIPGTSCRINAEMNVGGNWQPMYGDTQFTVSYSDGTSTGTFGVTILSGQNNGVALIPYSSLGGFLPAWISGGETRLFTYTVSAVSGEFCSGLDSAAGASIYWDNKTAPAGDDFPPAGEDEIVVNTTATTCKLFWRPISPATSPAGRKNGDFYEYRIKYRIYNEESPESWRSWNGTNDPALRYIANNPVDNPGTDSAMHFFEGRKYTSLPNLKLFTRYEYFIEAVDVFGNVTAAPAVPYQFSTLPYSTEIIVSDGISTYTDFTDLTNARSRTLRDTNIRVDMSIVATDTVPDAVVVWYTADTATDFVRDGQLINTDAFAADSLFSVEAVPTASNRWTAYLNSESTVIADGNTVRMIVETRSGSVSSYSDYDISDLDPNDDEWTIYIGTPVTLKPWPVRILNNVITKKNPAAYPAYYLSEDSYVTIMAYDIKGRAVAVILENAFRRGGQNIKENGWRGTNKTGRKLGVGLYYIKIFARSANSKKIILDKTEKVVIAY